MILSSKHLYCVLLYHFNFHKAISKSPQSLFAQTEVKTICTIALQHNIYNFRKYIKFSI